MARANACAMGRSKRAGERRDPARQQGDPRALQPAGVHRTAFIHATGIAGHDVVKYALDTYGDAEEVLSCTHDANSWPADFYAGLPAPAEDEEVVLWLQNSQPFEFRRARSG